jgi:hypothetical protein
MYIIRSNAKVHEFSESAKNEGVRTEKRAAFSPAQCTEKNTSFSAAENGGRKDE